MEYGEEDNCLFGKVLGLKKDCITYEGEIISELKSDFEGAILHGMAAANVSPILTLQHVLLIKICKIENVFLIHSDYCKRLSKYIFYSSFSLLTFATKK